MANNEIHWTFPLCDNQSLGQNEIICKVIIEHKVDRKKSWRGEIQKEKLQIQIPILH